MSVVIFVVVDRDEWVVFWRICVWDVSAPTDVGDTIDDTADLAYAILVVEHMLLGGDLFPCLPPVGAPDEDNLAVALAADDGNGNGVLLKAGIGILRQDLVDG